MEESKVLGSVKQSVRRIKPYVPGKPIEEVQREYGLKDVVKLASNENPLGPSPKAVKAMTRAVRSVHLYPESSVFYLREALSKKLGVKPENMIFGNGSNELEQVIAEAFVEPGDEVMFSELSFVVYPIVTDISGGKQVVVPHKDYGHDIEGFISRLSERTKLVFICNPNNPTGTIIKAGEFERFMRAVPEGTIVVLDEAYFEYAKGSGAPDGIKYLKKYPNLIVLRTFSKIYGLAGIRVGYGAASEEVASVIEKVRAPFNVNSAAQAGALAALKDAAHLKKTVAVNAAGKKMLYAGLKKMGIEFVPTHANFIFMKLPAEAREVFEKMVAKGVIIRPMQGSFARVTIGTTAQNKRFLNALGGALGEKSNRGGKR